jgi:hypothetical protein
VEQKSQQQKSQRPEEESLVTHEKSKKQAVLICESKIHKDFFIVLCEGSLEEWHINNINGYKKHL